MCEYCNNGVYEEMCVTCNGSGEAGFDGSTCYECKGKGVKSFPCENCDAGAEVYIYEPDPLDYL